MARRVLELTITLGAGTFGDDVGDTVTLTGFRITADIIAPGGDAMGQCQIRVYGLRYDLMNKLTTIGPVNTAIRGKNEIVLSAGDEGGAVNVAFKGTILDAWADYNAAPEVAFNIIAFAGLSTAVRPVLPTSYKGAVDVAEIINEIATGEMGLTFENNGVDVKMASPYLSGTALSKVRALAQAADILWSIDKDTLSIWPRDGARQGDAIVVSPDSGMVGYPSLSSKGMTVRMLFNPNIALGRKVEVQSAVQMACGVWTVFYFYHNLSCEMPDGPWFTTVEAYNAG